MPTQRFTLPAAVFLVLTESKKTLLMRRANTGWHDGDYDLVAGHIDGGESLRMAVAREAKEEIGIMIDPHKVQFSHLIHGFFKDGKEYFNIFFTVDSWEGVPTIMEPDKCDQLTWFNMQDLPKNMTESTRRYFEARSKNEMYSDFGFND